MVFEVDPDKPNTPAIARMLSGMGVLRLVASGICILLSFSAYAWVDETYTMIGAGAPLLSPTPKAPPLRQSQKERVIHVSEEQTCQQGFNLK
jgi:hypothetical protein